MIPKIIHYIWFGNKKPESVLQNINSFKKHTDSSWKIMEWNEDTIDLEEFPVVKYYLRRKQYAFASDYIRVWALYKFGGFYFDTDVELLDSLDQMIENHLLVSRTYASSIVNSTIASEPNLEVMKLYLDIYNIPKIYKRMPKIISSQIMTYAFERIYGEIMPTLKTVQHENYKILNENVFQLGVSEKGSKPISVHKHYANWKGKGDFKESIYLERKINFNKMTEEEIIKNKDFIRINNNKIKVRKKIDSYLGQANK